MKSGRRIQLPILIYLLLFAGITVSYSQKDRMDSLNAKEKEELALKNEDLKQAANAGDSVLFFKFFNAYKKEAKFNKDVPLLINCYSNLGVFYYYKNDLDNAALAFDSACKVARQNNYKKALAAALMNKGASFFTKQQYALALREYIEAEKTMNETGEDGLGSLLGNISLLYSEIGDLKNAKHYLLRSYKYVKKDSLSDAPAKFYNNLGLIYKKEKNYKAADSVFNIGLNIAKRNSLKKDMSDLTYNRMNVLIELKRYEEALELNLQLYKETSKLNDPGWFKMTVLNLAEINSALGKKKETFKYLAEAENIAWPNDMENEEMREDYYSMLGEIYQKHGKYEKAAEAYYRALMIEKAGKKDTEISNAQQLKFNSVREQDSIAFAKQQEIERIINEKEKQEAEYKLSQQRIIIGVSSVGLVIIALFSVSLLKANRSKEKANAELTEQKKIVSEKNKEITDSITYAKQIQQSLLPTQAAFAQNFPKYFLIYTPKDIVSGDFYWLKENIKKEIFIAVADCTGHGVPGAIMSALSIQQLNNISRIITEPGEVLQELNKKIKQNLKQDEVGFSKDGLDICLCKINPAEKKLYYSGANRSLLIFNEKGLKQEIKAAKAGIGGHTSLEQEYLQHEIKMEKGDYFVLSTDGFADQFGGQNEKKITTKHFKQWIAATGNHDFSRKGEELKERFVKWKKNVEQIDDVCVLGFKFE